MTSLARHVHWCSSGMNITRELAITSWLHLRATQQFETHAWHLFWGQEPEAKQVTGPMEECTTIILLNEHSSKLTHS